MFGNEFWWGKTKVVKPSGLTMDAVLGRGASGHLVTPINVVEHLITCIFSHLLLGALRELSRKWTHLYIFLGSGSFYSTLFTWKMLYI